MVIYHIGPASLRLEIMLLAAMLGGAFWCAVCAAARLYLRANEVITTLLMNYVASMLAQQLLYGAWRNPADSYPVSVTFTHDERLSLLGFGHVHAGIFIALGAALFCWWLCAFSRLGIMAKAVAANPVAARAVGIPVGRVIGGPVQNQAIAGISPLPAAWFHALPKALAGLLDQDLLTYAAFAAAIAVWFFIERTDAGLRLRAVGEDAPAADAAGISVFWVRIAAVLTGGAFCALAGTHLSLVDSHLWVDNMVAGRGWIAVAMVTLARWNALRAIAAAILFGAVEALVPQLLSSGMNVPVYLIEMSPYLATLAYLLLAGCFASGADAQPADLTRPYLREERR